MLPHQKCYLEICPLLAMIVHSFVHDKEVCSQNKGEIFSLSYVILNDSINQTCYECNDLFFYVIP